MIMSRYLKRFRPDLCFSAIAVAILVFGAGCGRKSASTVNHIKIFQGADQCAAPESECKKTLRFELLYREKGAFTGKTSETPVAGIPVEFKVLKGSDLRVVCENPVSDKGGAVTAKIFTGKKIGDQYFEIQPKGFPKAAKTIRITSGIVIDGSGQEVPAGNHLLKPISVKVYGHDLKPLPGAKVYFTVTSTPEKKKKTKCKPAVAVTDTDGVAKTTCKIGKATGVYKIVAEVSDKEHNIHTRGILIKEFGMNIWGLQGIIITVLGGLAIFIFGMKMMTDGLQLVAGNEMKRLLHFFTSNRFAAIAAGTIVTGVIQSSSACTVMVVGFVNAGLLNLTQAIGVVFGANIGTTVTAQIISFKLEKIALPAITVGLLVMFLSKRSVWKGGASAVMGFGLLFFGLGIMSHELKLIKDFPSIIAFFRQFDCAPLTPGGSMPFLSVLGALAIGTLMTVVIQSSSATIGIAIALAGSGLINFYTAVPLILGDNIGTTVTANLAALGANRRSKQTAFAHFLFNALGATYMICLFYWNVDGQPAYLYLINAITPGNVFQGENIVRHIAMAHTTFNVFNVLLFLPFINHIAKLCNIVIPIKEKDKVQHLEPHLLETPTMAIEQTIQSLRYMVKESWKMVREAMEDSFLKRKLDEKLEKDLMEREEKIDELQKDITAYLVQITERNLTEHQAGIVPLLMHCTNDAERIADHTENILALTRRLHEANKKLSDSAVAELEEVWTLLKNQAEHVLSSLQNTDKKDVNLARKEEKEIDKMVDRFESNHVDRLGGGKCDAVVGIIFLEILSELEKIGDHFSNIADRAKKIQKHHLNLSR